MNTLKVIFSLLFLTLIAQNLTAQDKATKPCYKPGFQLSFRGGYDFPTYHNNTPFIDYKGGLELGTSLDYYWRWFGIGADFDYLKNKPKNTYPTTPLTVLGTPIGSISNFSLTAARITRMFYGLGPSFRYEPSNKFTAELKLRGGLASIKGGRTELLGIQPPTHLLNFHAGYDLKTVLSAKAQVQFNYFFNRFFWIHAGAYYMRHFKATELTDAGYGLSASYIPFDNREDNNTIDPKIQETRTEACNCDISSIGAFAGVTVRLVPAKREKACNACDVFSLAVTARDKFSKQLLPNTDVALKNANGEVVQTGTTNNFGVVTFNNIIPDNYSIEGILYDVNLDGSTAMKSEFLPSTTLQKEILYSDTNFILKGKAVVCNSATPLQDVSVILKNTDQADIKNTMTDAKGEFIFHVKQQSNYLIYGKKENYFSQMEKILTSDFDRNTTLFIKLEICMEETDCENAIPLKNIHYDLDESFLRPEAKIELNRLVQFMTDNPGVNIEVRSHTDSRGSDKYNETLSQKRADAAVDYLVSQGIGIDRLAGRGYGETKLLNECADGVTCSESKHQLNRRTEMKVICPPRR